MDTPWRRCTGILTVLTILLSLAHAPRVYTSPVAQDDPEIVVQNTTPQPGQRVRGTIEISGYAADRRSPSGSGLNEEDIQIYAGDWADPRNLIAYAFGRQDSPSVA